MSGIPQTKLLPRARKCVEEWPTRRPEYADWWQHWFLNPKSGDLEACTFPNGPDLFDCAPAAIYWYWRAGDHGIDGFKDVCVARNGVILADLLPVKSFCHAMRADLARRNQRGEE